MRLTTWNVNGIRNPFGYAPWNTDRTFPAMFDILQSDIVVMQELKIQRKDLRDDMVLLDGWDCYFSLPKTKKGYSGVGIYTRNATCAPIKAEEGVLGVLSPPGTKTMFRNLPEEESIGGYPSDLQIAELGVDPALLDSEGRCVCLQFPAFVLFGVYSPANSNGLRDDFRYGFLSALDCRIRNLVKSGKNVVLVGDLNVSRSEIDTANGEEDMKKAGMTHEEYVSAPNRRIFNQMIIGGDVVGERDEGREEQIMWDLVREFHPDRRGMYTHWEQKINARPGNFGSRIDFVLPSRDMKDWFCDANIQEGLMGSDHCPVYGEFKAVVPFKTSGGNIEDRHMLDIMNPPGYFKKGERITDWSIKNVPVFSGKLLPEFDKRRSIKDMFKKPAMPAATSTQQINNHKSDSSSLSSTAQIDSTEHPWDDNDERYTASEMPASSSNQISTQVRSPGTKRKAAEAPPPKSVKRQKSNGQANATKSTSTKGQSSLKGFFASKANQSPTKSPVKSSGQATLSNGHQHNESPFDNALGPSPAEGLENDAAARDASTNSPSTPPAHQGDTESGTTPSPTKPEPPPPPSPSNCSTDGSVHDPIVAKDSWTKLMSKPSAPSCEHGEPCKVMLTKKKGENQGRSFWMCARPLGPSGKKEKNSQWRYLNARRHYLLAISTTTLNVSTMPGPPYTTSTFISFDVPKMAFSSPPAPFRPGYSPISPPPSTSSTSSSSGTFFSDARRNIRASFTAPDSGVSYSSSAA
ncbi:exodeoxyribonuclease III [Elsinoe australis]|uniref:DNA-(apurinic or apyrimidinic site) endonuclease 2 n=1 Tax=Elsinoe australis TaxID=40998 RepID=A0A2P7YFT3_9PEZI|nr:exodeoxyribonuclease III [Elsinoe australis]